MELNLPRSMAKMGALELELNSAVIVGSPWVGGFVLVARTVRDDRLVSCCIGRPEPPTPDLHGFFIVLAS